MVHLMLLSRSQTACPTVRRGIGENVEGCSHDVI